ncbi:MAG: zinc ABC transporter substrate-binding protein, partial [Rectinema sp.]|nr:zinc ABC transporter substrate-binding protein [Rectinema sp.]
MKRTGTARCVIAGLLLALQVIVAAPTHAAPKSGGPLRVAVSIPPMQEWVMRIAGERSTVQVVLPSGASPHAFEPSPRQLAELGTADVWFVIGVEFERALKPRIIS